MTEYQATAMSMYCRKCGYLLAGLSENRCPECGRTFDPAKRRTYLHGRHSWIVRRWCRRIGLAMASVTLLAVVGLVSLWGYVYWEYHADWLAERKAMAALNAEVSGPSRGAEGPSRGTSTDPKQVLAHVEIPDWTPWYYWLDDYLDRLCWPVSQFRIQVTQVMVCDGTDLTDADLASLAAFKHVRRIYSDLTGFESGFRLSKVTDGGLASLAGLSDLEALILRGTSITDSGLVHLYGLRNLSYLDVTGTNVTVEGVRQLSQVLLGVQIEGP